jgi:hypothetical protein
MLSYWRILVKHMPGNRKPNAPPSLSFYIYIYICVYVKGRLVMLSTTDEIVKIRIYHKINPLRLLVIRAVSGTGATPVELPMLLESSFQVSFYLHDIAYQFNLNIVLVQYFSYYLHIFLVKKQYVISRKKNGYPPCCIIICSSCHTHYKHFLTSFPKTLVF